jgi:hypothetical protein
VVGPPEHVHLFSPTSIVQILRECGFRPKVRTHGVNPAELLHAFRGGANGSFENRVGSSYQLNAQLHSSEVGRHAKDLANLILSTSRMGDSLKVWAVRV